MPLPTCKMSMSLIPRTCKYVMEGERDFSDGIKLRILRLGDCSGPNVITRILMRGRQKCQIQREGDVMMEVEAGVMHPEAKESWQSLELVKARYGFSPGTFRRN